MRLRRLKGRGRVLIDSSVHPQTIDVIRTRTSFNDIEVLVGDIDSMDLDRNDIICALVQYPGTNGKIRDYDAVSKKVHAGKGYLICAADPLSLSIMKPPSTFDADMVVGSTQRFGVPVWYGGPSAAYFATRKKFVRNMPGRLIGMAPDSQGKNAFRLTLQTREQHIRLDKATSNVCTAQALLASMASMYSCYHGPEGLRDIASQVKLLQQKATNGAAALGFASPN